MTEERGIDGMCALPDVETRPGDSTGSWESNPTLQQRMAVQAEMVQGSSVSQLATHACTTLWQNATGFHACVAEDMIG